MTGELFQWSYRHLNENANNLIKGLERAEREREGETMNESREENEKRKLMREEGHRGTRGRERWREVGEEREDGG